MVWLSILITSPRSLNYCTATILVKKLINLILGTTVLTEDVKVEYDSEFAKLESFIEDTPALANRIT